MVGRVGVEPLELLGVVGRAVLGDPGLARAEEVVADHVEQRHVAEHHREEVGPLDFRRADQKAAVRAAADGEPRRAGVAALDQLLGRPDEVVEDVLLVPQHSRAMPFLAVLAAAAQVGERPDAAALQPGIDPRGEDGPVRDQESAVAGEDGGRPAVELLIFLADDEHGNARAVLRLEEDLLDREGLGIDRHAEAEVEVRAAALHRRAPDLPRMGE